MTGLFEAWIKLLSEPLTWRRLVLYSAVLGAVFAGLAVYEHYTWSFRLARLQKSTDLLVRLQESELRGTNDSVELRHARRLLIAQTVEAINAKPVSITFVPSTLRLSMDTVWKFFAGGGIWYVIFLTQIRKWKSKAKRQELQSYIAAAAVAGLVAVFIPAVWWPWFHLFIYPWLFMAGVVFLIAPVAGMFVLWSGLKKAKDRAQAVSCLSNLKQIGIAARLWANDHGDVLPNNFAAMKKELVKEEITRCAADKKTQYEIISPGASEADPTIVYARCPIHNNFIFTDGTAHNLRDRRLVKQNGVWRVVPKSPSSNDKGSSSSNVDC